MRTRARLAEVLRSVNPVSCGDAVTVMYAAAEHLDGDGPCACSNCAFNMALFAMIHPSPHIREIAHQANVYLSGVTVQ